MSEQTQLDRIEEKLSILENVLRISDSKTSLVLAGIIGNRYKEPHKLNTEDIIEEAKAIESNTEVIEEQMKEEHAIHVKKVKESMDMSDLLNKILDDGELNEKEKEFIFPNLSALRKQLREMDLDDEEHEKVDGILMEVYTA